MYLLLDFYQAFLLKPIAVWFFQRLEGLKAVSFWRRKISNRKKHIEES